MPVRHMATTNEGLIRAEANLAGAYLSPDKGHRHFVTAEFATLLFAGPAYTTLLRGLKKNSCQFISTCAGHIVPHHIRSSCTCTFFFFIFLSIPKDERHFIFSKTLQNKQSSLARFAKKDSVLAGLASMLQGGNVLI